MQNVDVLWKLRQANLPVPVISKTTLPDSGFPELRAIIIGKEYKTEDGLVSFVISANAKGHSLQTRAAIACALMGKELTLSGVRVRYTSLAGLIRDTQPNRLYETENLMQPVAGEGYVIIPDVDEYLTFTRNDWFNALDWLGQHVNRGGGVILGKGYTEIEFPGSHFQALYSSFTTIFISAAK